MERRKIQLIAGSTYSVSLPKEWVKKNNLKEKDEIYISERSNCSLVIYPYLAKERSFNEISINIDEYSEDIDQILFALYYLSVEEITLFSKNKLKKEDKNKIRKTLTHMSGTEISYEDEKTIIIRVLLDKRKVDVIQVIYRILLIIDSSLANIISDFDIKEISLNENEIDRLYHLTTKIISSSQIDTNLLVSSNIKNPILIPSYFLIAKKLENIGDNINHLSNYLVKNNLSVKDYTTILEFIRESMIKIKKGIKSPKNSLFKRISESEYNKIKEKISKIKDQGIANFMYEIERYMKDIEQEIVHIIFYQKLMDKTSTIN